jgi:hypothetical protein
MPNNIPLTLNPQQQQTNQYLNQNVSQKWVSPDAQSQMINIMKQYQQYQNQQQQNSGFTLGPKEKAINEHLSQLTDEEKDKMMNQLIKLVKDKQSKEDAENWNKLKNHFSPNTGGK